MYVSTRLNTRNKFHWCAS